MNIIKILKDMCSNYPAFTKGNEKVQVVPFSNTAIMFFYRGREFMYNMEDGIIQMLYNGTIEKTANRS